MFYVLLVIGLMVSAFLVFGAFGLLVDKKESEKTKSEAVGTATFYLSTILISLISLFWHPLIIIVSLIHFWISTKAIIATLKTKKAVVGQYTKPQIDMTVLAVVFTALFSILWQIGIVVCAF
jgi:hypothetical protein